MKNVFLFIYLSLIIVNQLIAQTAAEIIAQCLDAHGGKDKIASLQYLKTTYIQHTNLVEQSERPTGPYIHDYQTGIKITDLKNQRSHLASKSLGLVYGSPEWMEGEYRYEDGLLVRNFNRRWYPMGAQVMDFREQLRFSPEQVLLNFMSATALTLEGKQPVQEVNNWKIKVQTKEGAFTAFINCYSNLLTAVEYQNAYKTDENFFWSFWGDYSTQRCV